MSQPASLKGQERSVLGQFPGSEICHAIYTITVDTKTYTVGKQIDINSPSPSPISDHILRDTGQAALDSQSSEPTVDEQDIQD